MKAFVCAAVLALATSGGLAQDKSSAKAQPVAGGEETIKMSAKVTAIDHAKRVVTLQDAKGNETALKVGEEARNLGQVKVGDIVNAEYRLAAVVSLKKGAGVRTATEATSSSRSKLGDKPGGTITQEGTIVADVIGIDAAKGTVSVKGPGGRVVHGKVADKALLNDVKVGDQVELDYVSSLAIQVVPGPKSAQTKK